MITKINTFRKINEGKAPGVNDGLWYHGDTRETDFSDQTMDAEDHTRDRNARGPGIYWTREEHQAKGYGLGGFLYTATAKIDQTRLMTADHRPTRWFIESFIRLAPMGPRKIGLSNWMNSMKSAIDAYMDDESLHEALMGVYNDFYGRDSRAFAKSMVKIGFDAYIHHLPGVDHLVVWNPKVMMVGNIVPVREHRSGVNENMSGEPYSESDATRFQYDFRRFVDGGMDDPKIAELGLKNLLTVRTAGEKVIINYDRLRGEKGVELMSLMGYKMSNKITRLDGALLKQLVGTIVKRFEKMSGHRVRHVHDLGGLGMDTLELDK